MLSFTKLLRGQPLALMHRRKNPKLKPQTILKRKQKKRLRNANLCSPYYTGQILPDQWLINKRIKAIGSCYDQYFNNNPGTKPILLQERIKFAEEVKSSQQYFNMTVRNEIQMNLAASRLKQQTLKYFQSQVPQQILFQFKERRQQVNYKAQKISKDEYRLDSQWRISFPPEVYNLKKIKRKLLEISLKE